MITYAKYAATVGFKPCYKWNAFNTEEVAKENVKETSVLNLVINGMPSILLKLNNIEQQLNQF